MTKNNATTLLVRILHQGVTSGFFIRAKSKTSSEVSSEILMSSDRRTFECGRKRHHAVLYPADAELDVPHKASQAGRPT